MIKRCQIAAVRTALCIALAAIALGPATAATKTYWQHDAATPGDWFEPTNWTDGVPQPGEASWSYIENGGTAQILDGTAFGGDRLYLGYRSTESGTLELTGTGQLSATREWVGGGGTGRFVHTGGTNTISNTLFLGAGFTGLGEYELSGTGQLSAAVEFVGRARLGGLGRFDQTGGSNAVGYLHIDVSSEYLFTGGTLQVSNGGLHLEYGTLDLGGSPVTVNVGDNTLVNLTRGRILNASQASLQIGANSLTILPAGFDPDTTFADFSTAGMLHTAGTELVLLAGQGFSGSGVIHDHVRCEGTISASTGGGLDLERGVTVSNGGSVTLGEPLDSSWLNPGGKLVVNDEISGISGGELSATYESVGHSRPNAPIHQAGRGRFTQTGGTNSARSEYVGSGSWATGWFIQTGGRNTISDRLVLGDTAATGAYELSGTAQLSANEEWIGDHGTGRFIQTGGTNTISYLLSLGRYAHADGTYELSGTGQLSAESEIIGGEGTGWFIQSGGTNTVEASLSLASSSGSEGTYDLSAGQLSANKELIGNRGMGTFIQSGGANAVSNALRLAYSPGSSGTYELSGSAQLSAEHEYIGYYGTGAFIQSGGTNTLINELYLAHDSRSSGTYELSGPGQLSARHEYIGNGGTGVFIQSGGTNTVIGGLYLAYSGSSGTYELRGGQLSANDEYIGRLGEGTFTQTGAENTVGSFLYLGYYSSSEGTYQLIAGQLSAMEEYIGRSGTGNFTQAGGSNTTGYLSVNAVSRYELSGGSLTVIDSAEVLGTLDLADGNASVTMGGIVDLADASVMRGGSASFTLDSDSLLIVPAGFDPATVFGSFTDSGSLVHEQGSTLVVAADQAIRGWGRVDDLVICQGTINATNDRSIDLGGGLYVSANGQVDLGLGSLTVENVVSGISGGRLFAESQYVGQMGIGQFTQTGGTNTISGVLSIAPGPDADGTYQLSDTGELAANWEVVGGHGTGRFIHIGGSNTITQDLSVGHAPGGDGTYHLSGSGQLSAYFEAVGEEGTGRFVQTGGTNSVDFVLRLAGWEGSTGTYELSGSGQLSAEFELVGSKGIGHFIQTGGANAILGDLSVGHDTGGDGTYHLGGTGHLSANKEFIGFAGTGRFVQTGGSNLICEILRIGYEPGSHGTYTISGGSLSTSDLSVQLGSLEIADSAAQITVSNKLFLGEHGTLTAVPGATIHMTGSALENQSVNPSALAGLSDLTLTFEGGEEDVDPVEVAGWDIGPVLAGFQDNFALGTLQLGGADVGRIRLVDEFDNRPGRDGDEALYVWNLNLGPSSYLDLGGLNLYFLNGAIDPSATIAGGTPTLVPEPSTVTLSVLGMLLLIALSRCRLRKPA